MKLKTVSFATAAGLIMAFCYGWTTVAALTGILGFLPFAQLLAQGYGFYGYSISWLGVLIGAFFGFIEGFVWAGAFALIYNKLCKK